MGKGEWLEGYGFSAGFRLYCGPADYRIYSGGLGTNVPNVPQSTLSVPALL